jgi:phenylpropionate dioxygenase-like ring-hydroxylating dioxygenase large terminal subunit
VSGTCRQFTCKYHGWRYALDGQLTFVQQEAEFFDLDRSDFRLVPVRCEVWEGFVFVNLDDEDTRRAVRWPQAVGHRPRDGRRRPRGVPRGEDDRPARGLIRR